MNIRHQVAGFLFLMGVSVFSQELRKAEPGEAGFSAERLAAIDRMIEGYVTDKKVPGAVALVARNGRIVYHKGIGFSNIGAKRKMEPDAIFRIASQTKAITSVAVMMLFEEGKLLLDDPVSRYVPEFKDAGVLDKFNPEDSTYTTVPAKREVTIRDLLTHTSGMGYSEIGSREATAIYARAGVSAMGIAPARLSDKMKILAGLPLMHQPGEKFTYGLNTDMLGYVVEVISGIPLNRFFRERIFDPLGMKDTYFYLPADRHNRLAGLYTENEAGETVEIPRETLGGMDRDYPTSEGTYFSGGAGLSSTAYDYSVFLQMLLNGGKYNGRQLLAPGTVRLMTVNQIKQLSLSHNNKFGLGFEVVSEEGSSVFPWKEGSFSWGGYFGSHYWVDPSSGIVAVIFTQEVPNSEWGDISVKFKNIVYSALIQ